jgi:hypothetical protein
MIKIIPKIFRKFGYELRRIKLHNIDNYTERKYDDLFNLFSEWKSKFIISGITYGGKNDYGDPRISMLNLPELYNYIKFENKSVLELGPLEGGNSIILEKLKIKSNLSIEGRVENYIKCCIIKNIFDLNKTKYILDNVMDINIDDYNKFDIAVVLGILYHLDKPHLLIDKLSKLSDEIIISTHYADENSPYPNAKELIIKHNDYTYKGRSYIEDPNIDPNAGLQNYSFWPYKNDLIEMIRNSGFINIHILKENINPEEQYKLIYLVAKK